MPSEPDDAVVVTVAKALREFDLSEANAGLLTDEEFRGFYHNAARAVIAAARPLIEREALERVYDKARGTNADLCKTPGAAYRVMLDAIRNLGSAKNG